MKFINEIDQRLYQQELKLSQLSEADFIRKRHGLIKRVKDRQRSRETKKQWRHNRWKILKGIKRFHKSTQGKRFHRQLGRFLALRDFKGPLAYREARDLVMPISSVLTHAFLEQDYFMPLSEQINYELFCDEVYEEVLTILDKLQGTRKDISGHEDFLCRICETTALIKSFADKYGKSEEEVEELWDKAKEVVKKDYGRTEDDENFYSLLVGILKKMLKGLNGK